MHRHGNIDWAGGESCGICAARDAANHLGELRRYVDARAPTEFRRKEAEEAFMVIGRVLVSIEDTASTVSEKG